MEKNNMKKKKITFLLILTSILITNCLFASDVYLSLNTGYGFNISSQKIGTIMYTNDGSNTSIFNQKDFSFGKGFNFGGAVGYMYNKNIGAEMGFSYLNSVKTRFNSFYEIGTQIIDFSSGMFRINPSVIIVSGMSGINPYAKFGVIIGSGFIEENDQFTINTNSSTLTQKLNGGFAIGLTASLGVKYKLSGKISVFGELNMVNLSYAPTKGEVITYSIDGTDRLTTLTTSERLTDYLKSYIVSSSQPAADTEPGKSPLQNYPFGSFGLNIGLIYNL